MQNFCFINQKTAFIGPFFVFQQSLFFHIFVTPPSVSAGNLKDSAYRVPAGDRQSSAQRKAEGREYWLSISRLSA